MTNENRKPIWGDDDGVVTSYMCKIDFDHELGSAPCTKLYPSVEALKEAHKCVDDCGIVKVLVADGTEDDPKLWDSSSGVHNSGKPFRLGWMEVIEFSCELGGAKTGNGVYSSEAQVRKERPYAEKYGVVRVVVTLDEVVQEAQNENLKETAVSALTDEMKAFIIDYNLPQGSFSKGMIEDDNPLATAYDEGTVTSDDIYNFMDECREKLLEGLNNSSPSEQMMPEGDTSPRT